MSDVGQQTHGICSGGCKENVRVGWVSFARVRVMTHSVWNGEARQALRSDNQLRSIAIRRGWRWTRNVIRRMGNGAHGTALFVIAGDVGTDRSGADNRCVDGRTRHWATFGAHRRDRARITDRLAVGAERTILCGKARQAAIRRRRASGHARIAVALAHAGSGLQTIPVTARRILLHRPEEPAAGSGTARQVVVRSKRRFREGERSHERKQCAQQPVQPPRIPCVHDPSPARRSAAGSPFEHRRNLI